MTITATKAYRTWRQRLAAPTIGHGSVVQLCRNIIPVALGYDGGGKRTVMTDAETVDLLEQLRERWRTDGGPRAEPQKEDLGREWLTKYQFTHGLPRRDYMSIVEFRLAGFHFYDRWSDAYGEHADIAPVWRAKWDDPDVMPLCYAPAAWQSRRKGDALWWDVR